MKMRHKAMSAGLVLLAALAAGCFRNTSSEIELAIPEMATPACEEIVREAVAALGMEPEGPIEEIRTDSQARKAWVVFDNVRLGRRNIEVVVRHAGFAVNDLPADEEQRAKLPKECGGP